MSTFRTLAGHVAMIRRVHSPRGRQRAGLYSIEGTRLVERALRAGAPLHSVLAASRLAHSADPRLRALWGALAAAGCPVTFAADEVVNDLIEGRDLGAMLGLVRLPPVVTLAELVATADGRATTNDQQPATPNEPPFLPFSPALQPPCSPAPLLPHPPTPPLFLAALDIVDPGNAGALTRTAHAAGATALLAVGASDPFHPRATRISRGSIFRLPVIYYADTGELFDDLRRCGVIAVGTAAAGGAPLPAFAWPARPTAVLMGNEAEGLPPELAAVLDFTVTIPMTAGVDSYSVNAAAAIVCFVRQSAVLVGPELN